MWTLVEVVDTRVRGGHVYLEVSERYAHGTITAWSAAVILCGLTRTVRELGIPVLTGVGHERGTTVLDKWSKSDLTPRSSYCRYRVDHHATHPRSQWAFAVVPQRSQRGAERTRRTSTQTYMGIEGSAHQTILFAQQRATKQMSDVKLEAVSLVCIINQVPVVE